MLCYKEYFLRLSVSVFKMRCTERGTVTKTFMFFFPFCIFKRFFFLQGAVICSSLDHDFSMYFAELSQVLVLRLTVPRNLKYLWVVSYRCVALQQFMSSDGLVQARLAHVDVTFLGEGWQQREQSFWVDIVIIVHMTKPPEERSVKEKEKYSVKM